MGELNRTDSKTKLHKKKQFFFFSLGFCFCVDQENF
uniref:Uncharacterized protein n=1 Tax=Rhizophora mucronata TaxID=61149 RepID=A0A2P2NR77_RHIMU